MQSGTNSHLCSYVIIQKFSAGIVNFPMPTSLSVASSTKDQAIIAKPVFPTLHLHVLRSKARAVLASAGDSRDISADDFCWERACGVLACSLDTVCHRDVFRLDAKAGGLCPCLSLWPSPCSILLELSSVTCVVEKFCERGSCARLWS